MRRSDEVILPRASTSTMLTPTRSPPMPLIVRPIATLDDAFKVLGLKGESHVAF